MTEHQVKFVKFVLYGMIGMTAYQSLVIMHLNRKLNYGRNQFEKLRKGAMYLLEVINENDIELSEFDLIALAAITEGES